MLGTSYLTKSVINKKSKSKYITRSTNLVPLKTLSVNGTDEKKDALQPKKKCVHRVSTSKHTMTLTDITPEVIDDSPFSTHIDYILWLENLWNGRKWQVRRRFSTFYKLKNQIETILELPHCHYCADAYDTINRIDFPSRRLIGSNSPEVAAIRSKAFKEYIRILMKVITSSYFQNCALVSRNLRIILYKFITGDSIACSSIYSENNAEHANEDNYSVPSLLQQLSRSCRYNNCVPLDTIYEIDNLDQDGCSNCEQHGFHSPQSPTNSEYDSSSSTVSNDSLAR